MRLSRIPCLFLSVLLALILVQCEKPENGEDTPDLEPSETLVVDTNLDKTKMFLGEDIRLTITAVHRTSIKLELPHEIQLPENLQILDSGRTGPEYVSGTVVRQTAWYDISTTVPGSYAVPGIRISYTDDQGVNEYMTRPLEFSAVRTVQDITKVEDIRDIKPPQRIARDYSRILVLAVSFVVGAALVFLVYSVVKRRRLSKTVKQKIVPPKIRALEELRKIEETRILEEGKYAEFVVNVSSVVRRYLHEQFSVPAKEMTTEEVLERADKGYYLSDESRRVVRELMSRCDDVKFAAQSPGEAECAQIYDEAIRFIEKSG